MKIKTLLALSIMPLIQIGGGLWGISRFRYLPEAEPARHLRAYIGTLEIDKEQMNTKELGMLTTLQSALASLDDYYREYNPQKDALKSYASASWWGGAGQVILILALYCGEKKKASPTPSSV